MQSAIVIGASSGVGEAVARRLVEGGWRVLGVARRERPDRPGYRHAVADVRSPGFASELGDLADAFGPVDVCVYCAGVGELLTLPALEHDHDVIATNLLGAVTAAAVLIPRMIARRGGHFVGLSSLADRQISADAPSYAASKAGLSSYLEGLALACQPHGVAVTNVRLGFVDTAMAKSRHKPFMVSADRAASVVLRCLAARPIRETFPLKMALLLWFVAAWQELRVMLPRGARRG